MAGGFVTRTQQPGGRRAPRRSNRGPMVYGRRNISAPIFAGAPRLILAVTMVPLVITVRSALTRGVRLSRLVN
jgi:hypothetical protein